VQLVLDQTLFSLQLLVTEKGELYWLIFTSQ